MANITKEQMQVLINCIGALETGGQVFGCRRYDDYTNAYTNSSAEDSITIGAFQEFKSYAKALLQEIKDTYPSTFKKYDNANIANDLKQSSWSGYNPAKTSAKAKAIVAIISSEDGKKVQDTRIVKLLNQYIAYAESLGVTDIDALFMCANFIHQGGNSACKRLVGKISKPYTLDKLYTATLSDTGNQVGVYKTRQKLMYQWIKQYITEANPKKEVTTMGKYDNYFNSTGTHYISNSGSDENGGYHSGAAGDQTGNEWCIRSWYNRPWGCVLRHPDANVRLKIAELACAAALNNKIGYDQYQRDTYWQQLQSVGFDPSKITVACESDCSAGVIANVKAVGHLMNLSALKNLTATYTGNMKNAFKNAGFTVLTESKYLTGYDYLLPGDILLNEEHHTATNLTKGSKASATSTVITSSALTKGSTGEAVKTMQKMLIACGYSCGSAGADGDFGSSTLSALKKFQSENGLTVDGSYGEKSKAALEKLYASKTKTSNSTTPTTSGGLNKTCKWKGTVDVNAGSTLNVRKWAGANNETCSFSPLKRGTVVEVCDSTKASDGSKWYYIKYNGKYGFVHSDYIKK